MKYWKFQEANQWRLDWFFENFSVFCMDALKKDQEFAFRFIEGPETVKHEVNKQSWIGEGHEWNKGFRGNEIPQERKS